MGVRPQHERENKQRENSQVRYRGIDHFPVAAPATLRYLEPGFGGPFPDNMLRPLRIPHAGMKRLRLFQAIGSGTNLLRAIVRRNDLIHLLKAKFVVHKIIITDLDQVRLTAMPIRCNDSTIKDITPLPLHTGAYFSNSLGREQPYAYFAPPGFGTEQTPTHTRWPLLILLHGKKGNYRTWPEQTRLAFYAAEHNMFLAFPEGGEGWSANAYDGQANYENDLMQDFVPHLQQTLPLLPSGKDWTIGGMSMGGQGAVKIALKYGRTFGLALSFSGAFEITKVAEPHPVFGDPQHNAPLRRASNVFSLAEDALSTWPPARPNLYLACGADDPLVHANRRFHQHLDYIGYRHTYVETPGHHTLPYWNRAIRAALVEVDR